MGKTLTTEEFIQRARKVHGDKYDYSKVEYIDNRTKVCIICPEHSEFMQQGGSHLDGRGCPECAKFRTGQSRRMTKEQFIEKAIALHGDKYDYSKVDYQGSKNKVCIICPIHGEFWQQPNGHLSGHKCPKCSNENKVTRECNSTEWFIERAISVHGDKYDYSRVDYRGASEKVLIICPKHGVFYQTGYTHLKGSGCPQCALENKRTNKDEFIRRCNEIHNNKYDYSLTEFTSLNDRIKIICPVHGVYEQVANCHLSGQGCAKCSYESRKHPVFGFGINDYDGFVVNSNGDIEPFYSAWHSMIRRCYSEYHHKLNPAYIGCTVCDEWKYLSNFKKWFDENYIDGCHLDKDILVQDNKVYSPSTCCFVPQYINSLLTDHRAARGAYKLGVRKENGKFVASVNDNTRSVHIGSFATEDEAFNAYVKAKKEVIEKTARRALNEGLINEDIYKALINRKIKEY